MGFLATVLLAAPVVIANVEFRPTGANNKMLEVMAEGEKPFDDVDAELRVGGERLFWLLPNRVYEKRRWGVVG